MSDEGFVGAVLSLCDGKKAGEKENVMEALEAENQMLWVQKMNSIRNAAMEIISNDLIYA